MRGPRPRYFVARSTKFLAVQTLMGREYRSLFSNGPELMIALDRVPVSMVVLNESVPQKSGKDGPPLTKFPSDFPEHRELPHSVRKESGGQIRTCKLISNEGKAFNRLRIDMRYTLVHSIETQSKFAGRITCDTNRRSAPSSKSALTPAIHAKMRSARHLIPYPFQLRRCQFLMPLKPRFQREIQHPARQ